MIKAIRISKSSLKCWQLHGPIEAALKTTIQADAVRVIPLRAPLHGIPTDLELWVDAVADDIESRHSPNVPATAMVMMSEARQKGLPITSSSFSDEEGEVTLTSLVAEVGDHQVVHGPAVLIGAGASDIPEVRLDCLMAALMNPGDE